MRTKLKHLSFCIFLIGLSACSSKNHQESNSAVESQGEETAVSLDTVNQKSAVIVPKEQMSADQSWAEIDGKVLDSNPSIPYPRIWESLGILENLSKAHDFLLVRDYEQIKTVLNLNKDQIFVIGDKDRDTEENNVLLNLSNNEYFKYANNLAINYVRYLKSAQAQPKQEFEKNQDYENRVSQAKQAAENRAVDYDVELLQKSLNRSVEDIYLASSDTSYEYDADKEQLSLKFEQKNKYGSSIAASQILLKVQPKLAKTIIDNLSRMRMGYVFSINSHQLKLDGVFFYFEHIGKAGRQGDPVDMVMNITPVLKPITFKQKSAIHVFSDEMDIFDKLAAAPFKEVLASPVWNFKFGLENYLSPEALLQKYPPQQDQTMSETPEEENEL